MYRSLKSADNRATDEARIEHGTDGRTWGKREHRLFLSVFPPCSIRGYSHPSSFRPPPFALVILHFAFPRPVFPFPPPSFPPIPNP
jgi:hypothetical protein